MLKFAANISTMFTEHPLLDRFAAARDAGFEAVEVLFPYEEPATSVAAAATSAGLEVVLINASITEGQGRPGLACRPELETQFRDSLKQAEDYALALGVRQINVLAGSFEANERDVCLATLRERLAQAADDLAGDGISILIEPINPKDRPDYAVPSFDAAMDILKKSGRPNLGLQFDVYHAAMMGLDPIEAFNANLRRIWHVQFSDMPGRHEPGSGAIDYPKVFEAIDKSGYDGWLSAEYHPSGKTLDSLGWFKPYRK
ncbi:MAG TPA: TIM barrel protein [Alphaproteobacteria bacterium]|nr:TIM barrel protein [Alphaproteobacteria bacterium]